MSPLSLLFEIYIPYTALFIVAGLVVYALIVCALRNSNLHLLRRLRSLRKDVKRSQQELISIRDLIEQPRDSDNDD